MLPQKQFDDIDHMAIAVHNLEEAIDYYITNMGFKLDCIRDTAGKYSGMRSAVLFSDKFSVVLIKSLTEDSQVDKYIKRFGPGVQHIAFAVDDIHRTYEELSKRGMKFSTQIIEAAGLRQLFSKRDPNTGMMHEFIERTGQTNFVENNVNQLFEQLEASNEY